ncbi:MAG: DsbA family protein [Alphaproteobacteria bacterium]|nr:DsbA family protein [Alphaproteobacteria bacterium]
MTKHTIKKVSVPHHAEKKETTSCSCGDKCSCCQCSSAAKVATMGVSALALVLAVVALIKPPCSSSLEKWVKGNPEVIDETMKEYYQKKDAERRAEERAQPKKAPADLVEKIISDKANYSLGNPKGKYVIIEFFDYNCGWCKRTNAALKEALAKPEAKNIRWIPIDTPIFGEDSERIARFVLAAGEQGKYAAMHDAVGDHKGRVDEAALMSIAKKIGADAEKMKKAAESQKIKDKLAANREFTKALKIGGVPMLIVNGNIHPGALFGEELDEVVAESAK